MEAAASEIRPYLFIGPEKYDLLKSSFDLLPATFIPWWTAGGAKALTRFISQQRVGGLSVSLISAAGAANSHRAPGERFQSEAAAAAEFESRTTFPFADCGVHKTDGSLKDPTLTPTSPPQSFILRLQLGRLLLLAFEKWLT